MSSSNQDQPGLRPQEQADSDVSTGQAFAKREAKRILKPLPRLADDPFEQTDPELYNALGSTFRHLFQDALRMLATGEMSKNLESAMRVSDQLRLAMKSLAGKRWSILFDLEKTLSDPIPPRGW